MRHWILMAVCASCVTGAASLAHAQAAAGPPFRPVGKSAVRVGVGIAGDLRAHDGFGFGVDYDIPVTAEAGPGRLLLGPSGIVAFGRESHTNNLGCDIDESETVIAVLGSLRYVFDINPRLRPWARLGLGLQIVDYTLDASGCPFADDLDEQNDNFGPGAVLGLGLDIDLSPSTLVSVAVDGHQGEDDFATLSVAFGWRF